MTVPKNWRHLPAAELEVLIEQTPDDTELWDQIGTELDRREHDAWVLINNGGILP